MKSKQPVYFRREDGLSERFCSTQIRSNASNDELQINTSEPRALAPCVVAAIDAELQHGRYHSLNAERLRFARWILTSAEDEIDELFCELEDSGAWDSGSDGGY